MYRERWHMTVPDSESWDEVERLSGELNTLAASRGWTQDTLWTPTAGPWGEVIIESDFPDLATYEREWAAYNADPEWLKLTRQMIELRTQGTTLYNELLETV